MSELIIPKGYRTPLDEYDMQSAIDFVKEKFQKGICSNLNLKRVSAPLIVTETSGLNDNLNGYERPVTFDIPAIGADAQVVHSLAKWKRLALKKYGFHIGEGVCTDMNAIRRDEELDNLHSVYVDQWDWEKIIVRENRNLPFLQLIVKAVVRTIVDVCDQLHVKFPQLKSELSSEVFFIRAQEAEDLYPDLTPEERENVLAKEHKTICIMQIGDKLRSGIPHSGRAPDYDDWQLNCDILFWSPVLQRAVEVSSMGIRVDEESMARQLKEAGCEERRNLPFHRMLLGGELPLTIGGGIGQSRLCLLMLGCAHIGEVQVSLWDPEVVRRCAENGIRIL